jgi:hypothetical protein
MPIEIRELIIKTEVSTTNRNNMAGINEQELDVLKKQLLDECKRIISGSVKKNNQKR